MCRLPFAVCLLFAFVLLPGRRADACAPAYREGNRVRIDDESAIIVWDEASKTEHFIRRASFSSDATDFGFLVPTPSVPELAEARNEPFDALEQRVSPGVVYRAKIDGVKAGFLCALPFYMFLGRSEKSAVAPAAAPVRVLHAQTLAGYDAVVLEADRSDALAAWLREHGYATRPALEAWLQPYVTARWKITAFKIAPRKPGDRVATSAVRMSFTTERPFFPYREPADEQQAAPSDDPANATPPERRLRVFLIARSRMEGALGDGRRAWPGQVTWATLLAPRGAAPPTNIESIPIPFEDAWLTAFEDNASPRPGVDEVYFSPATDPSPFLPEPVVIVEPIKLPLPLDVLAVIGGGIYLAWRSARSRQRPPPSTLAS
ncbi:DUF2330 domain-containing protein [Chondromyces crocatus]|uniref:DUF2330 domain-containing protein n=1 Tax=Chondromyces crocatus TaxID=52 RepID=A0A0K1ETR0_CHOCO|nr:DUF2330 domain-containing protein [Chondromyces crocatus]AKT44037.1 uncharacterized protein CMC5_082750 [Chondromyces crocatus]